MQWNERACSDLDTYGDALNEIFSNRLNEWEGTLRAQIKVTRCGSRRNTKLQVMLRDTFDGWSICWRSQLDGNFETIHLKIGDAPYQGYRSYSWLHNIPILSDKRAGRAWQLLNDAAQSRESIKQYRILWRRSTTRQLIWRFRSFPHGGFVGSIPLRALALLSLRRKCLFLGPLYLLSRLTDLSQERKKELASKFERIPDTDGLPSEWVVGDRTCR